MFYGQKTKYILPIWSHMVLHIFNTFVAYIIQLIDYVIQFL